MRRARLRCAPATRSLPAIPTGSGWVQADAVFGKFRDGDDARLAKLVQSMDGFDQIEAAVEHGEVDVGLLIHEGQLTYVDSGFQLWEDLGAWWLADTGLPLPLGGNVVRRDLGDDVVEQIARDLKASIVYALEHRAPALAHARQFNRGIGDERTDTFVGMYVNEWTVDYGPRGRQAVQALLDRAWEAELIPEPVEVQFVG